MATTIIPQVKQFEYNLIQTSWPDLVLRNICTYAISSQLNKGNDTIAETKIFPQSNLPDFPAFLACGIWKWPENASCTSLTSFHEMLLSAKKLTFFSFVTGILEKLYKKCFSLFTPLAMHSEHWWAPRENTDYYLPRMLQIKVYIIYIQFFHNDFSWFIILHLFPCFKVLLVSTT